jgi:cytochrome c
MKSFLIAAVAVASVAFAGAAQAQEALAKEKGCMTCHAIDKKKVGPGYKEVAAKFKGQADAEAKLSAEVSGGGKHPKVKADEAEVKNIVKWILTL